MKLIIGLIFLLTACQPLSKQELPTEPTTQDTSSIQNNYTTTSNTGSGTNTGGGTTPTPLPDNNNHPPAIANLRLSQMKFAGKGDVWVTITIDFTDVDGDIDYIYINNGQFKYDKIYVANNLGTIGSESVDTQINIDGVGTYTMSVCVVDKKSNISNWLSVIYETNKRNS